MLWFEGSIPAAIASAKQQNSVFVVVITGDDELSEQMMSSWEDEAVAAASNNSFVAIKIDAKSETCVQFSQIYPVVCIPSSFFIGENGIPLEVVAGSVSAEELTKRIQKVKQMHFQQAAHPNNNAAETEMHAEPSPQTSTEAVTAAAAPEVQPSPQQHTPASPEPEPEAPTCPMESSEEPAPVSTSKESLSRPVEENGAVGALTPGDEGSLSLSSDDVSLASQSEEGLDAKVDRLTKKLEERREQKKKGEEETEIRKEVERRKMGKEMLDFKRKHEDDRTKRMLEERNREKAEEKAARDRVKQQIALDRADRAARYAQNHEEVEAARIAALQARQAEQEARKEHTQRERSAIARIQFRLPDGSSFTNQFSSDALLQEAHHFAAQEVGNRYGHFSLATMFPRREFKGEDLEKTLQELELAPSASIVLLPSGRAANAVVHSSDGGLWALLGTILYPLLAVWRFLSGFLFSSPPPPSGGAATGATASASASASSAQGPPQHRAPQGSNASTSGEPKRETIRKRGLEKRPEDFKKDGKIYRLRTQEDSEDDQNTWNGNSTQQM
ncbi:UBX domain-containing protein 4 isoform X2 [Engraulis encrasicolus]|uniref:UBX domain-containing protein 4 isoform X2 n=1 Tax=Engraulis encrasicolus TaxID=184585 RepID=UPI002FD68651